MVVAVKRMVVMRSLGNVGDESISGCGGGERLWQRQ